MAENASAPRPVWSSTRGRTLDECRRKYWYRYHLAPTGRNGAGSEEARSAWEVRNLQGLDAWAGTIVHEVLELVLGRWRGGRDYPEEEAVRMGRRILSRQFRASLEWFGPSRPEDVRTPLLLDHHYFQSGPLAPEDAQRLKDHVDSAIRNFLRSELAERIRAAGPASWKPIDRNAAVVLDSDLTILVKPDFAFADGGTLQILDWKTGRPDGMREVVQLSCYILYAEQKWGYPRKRIMARCAHLHPSFRYTEPPTPEEIDDALALVRRGALEIRTLAGSSWETGELPARERYDCTEDPRRCRWCQFRGLCEGAQK